MSDERFHFFQPELYDVILVIRVVAGSFVAARLTYSMYLVHARFSTGTSTPPSTAERHKKPSPLMR